MEQGIVTVAEHFAVFFLKVMAECCYKKKCLPLTMMKSKHFMNKTFLFLF